METKTLNIYQKLLEIQKSIKGFKKDKKGFNYEYVTGGKVLEFIKPLMNAHGLILKQEVLSIDNEVITYFVNKWVDKKQVPVEKTEVLSKAMMRFTWIDTATGEKDENSFGANGFNEFEKGLGSALTYAERYFLLKYFHIATNEDDIDNPERKPQEEVVVKAKNKPIPVITKEMLDKILIAKKESIEYTLKSIENNMLKATAEQVLTIQNKLNELNNGSK